MFRFVVPVALAALMSLPDTVRAEICGQAVVTRINEKGLAFLAAQIPQHVPKKITVPATRAVVVDWPLSKDDATVVLEPLEAKVSVHKLAMGIVGDALRVQGTVSFATAGPVTVLNPYASYGRAECRADVALDHVSFDIHLAMKEDGGRVATEVRSVKVRLPQDRSKVSLSGCLLGDALGAVGTFIGSYFTKIAESVLEDLARKKLPELAAAELDKSVSHTFTYEEFYLTARLDGLYTTMTGVELRLGADLGLINAPPGPPPCASEDVPIPGCGLKVARLDGADGAMFSVGVTAALLNRGLHAAWRSGRLCISSDQLTWPLVREKLSELSSMMALPASTKVTFDVRFSQPPTVQLHAATGIRLAVNDLSVTMRLVDAAGKLEQTQLRTNLVVLARPWVDPRSNTIALDLHGARVDRFDIQGGKDHGLVFDAARLERFITNVVVPMVQRALDDHQLSPSLIPVESYVVELKHVVFGDGFMAAHLDGHVFQPSGDTQPPETYLAEAPASPVVAPGMLRLLVSATDNRTPVPLLRFAVRVDGGQFHAPHYGSRVDVLITPELKTVEIAAVDEDGNIDPTPVFLALTVDAGPPKVEITARPTQIIEHSRPAVGFVASDDRSTIAALKLSASLYRIPGGGGAPWLVSQQKLAAGSQRAEFSGLEDGAYKIRITARDEAGNVTSRDVGFFVETALGCRIGGAPGANLPLILILLLAFWYRRMR